MGSASLRINYRPIQVGLCVPYGDFVAFNEAVRITTTLWGGRYNPIVPVGDTELATSLVESFRPDYLYGVRQTEPITQFIDSFPELRGVSWHGRIYEGKPGDVYARLLPSSAALGALYQEYVRGRSKPEIEPRLVTWSPRDPLANVFLCQYGSYPSSAVVGYDYKTVLKEHFKAKTKRILLRQSAPNPFETFTQIGITAYNLEEDYRTRSLPYGGSGVFLGDASSFDDLCIYWNLLAAGYFATFYDPSFADRCLPSSKEFAKSVIDTLAGRKSSRQEATLWTTPRSLEIEVPDLEVPTELALATYRQFRRFNPTPARMVFPEQAVFGAVDENQRKILNFPLPEKPWPQAAQLRSNAHVAVDVDCFARTPGKVYFPPDIPALNRDFDLSRDICFAHDLRTKREGVSFVTKVWSTDGQLAPLSVHDLAQQVFRYAGIDAKVSKAGRVATRLIDQMGGIQGCRVFKLAGVRKLITDFQPDKSFSFGDAMRAIGREWQQDNNDLYIDSRETPDLTKEQVFTFLLRKEVFRTGFELKCDNCLLDAWHSLEDTKSKVQCPYCGEIFNASVQLRRDSWQYRRSGLFGRNDNQDGSIPVALVLQQLDTTLDSLSPDTFGFTCGFDLSNVPGLINGCEADFLYLTKSYDKELQIALGECKSFRGKIDDQDIYNLGVVSDLLWQKGIAGYIIFAKTGTWTKDEVSRCLALNGDYRKRVIILGPRELEPYFMYARVKAENPSLDLHALSLEDMSIATLRTYGQALRDGTLPDGQQTP